MDNDDIIILTQEECVHCASAKNLLKEHIASGKIRTLDINSQEGWSYVEKHDVKGTPTVIVKNKLTSVSESCKLASDGSKIMCNTRNIDLNGKKNEKFNFGRDIEL